MSDLDMDERGMMSAQAMLEALSALAVTEDPDAAADLIEKYTPTAPSTHYLLTAVVAASAHVLLHYDVLHKPEADELWALETLPGADPDRIAHARMMTCALNGDRATLASLVTALFAGGELAVFPVLAEAVVFWRQAFKWSMEKSS